MVDVRVILLVEGDIMGEYLHPYIESGALRVLYVYVLWLQTHQRRDGLSHYQNSTSLLAFDSIFERFLGTDVGWCEGRTLG